MARNTKFTKSGNKHQSIYFGVEEWEEVKKEAERLEISASEVLRKCWQRYSWQVSNIPNREYLRLQTKQQRLKYAGGDI